MNQTLTIYRVGWTAVPPNQEFYCIRHPPLPGILKYWQTGYGGCGPNGCTEDVYVGLVAVPDGVDPLSVVQCDFPGAKSRDMTILYDPVNHVTDRFTLSAGDWDTQRLAYLLATGQLLSAPVVGHYEKAPGFDNWWCTTQWEFFDL